METKDGWKMYIDIKHLKGKGFSNTKIADMLDISRPSVAKYVDMEPEEFYQEMEGRKHREKKPDKYKDNIVGWLKQYPQMTAAQVFDWLEEKYGDLIYTKEFASYSITYQVRKDNIVPIKGNRYTVPTGTYRGPYTNVGAGVGKTHLSIGIGIEAINNGYKVRFTTMPI